MAEKKAAAKQEGKESYTIKYTGTAAETSVVGLGSFSREVPRTIEGDGVIKRAKHLVRNNVNFKEVKS